MSKIKYIRILSTLILLTASGRLQSQNLSGRVVDERNHPIEFANVVLYSLPDSVLVTGTITDTNGEFAITDHFVERGFLQISFMGYKTQTANAISGMLITLSPEVSQLSEVTVTAARPNITNRNGVLTTTVVGSVLANEHTLTDLLGKIPGIISDQGGISVFGGGSPIYYLDNRRVRSGTELSMLDVKNIRKVELLTNAGAKYGADVTAVIKIYTLHRATGLSVEAGANGSLSERFSHGEHASIGYKTKRLNLSAYYGYSDYRNRSHQFSIKGIEADTARQYTTDSHQLPRSREHDYSLSADWEINKK